ncbi:MAG: aldolase [Methanotrichaceae archaeon]|nr:aldolase [Methanotrichaceae archaeon]
MKSEIYGCCIKLLTAQEVVKNRWEENFYSASQNIRSHGRLYVLQESTEAESKVYYDPQSKTAFLFNFDYYGWIKSIALSLAGDILEDEHGTWSIHGACLDARGRGICMVGGSGAGKTTHTYGLLRNPRIRVVSDDWFFARIYGNDILAYGTEKNFYIRADLSDIWKEYSWLVQKAYFDEKGRSVVDIRWIIGKGRILPISTLEKIIILKRDPEDKDIVKELERSQAMEILKKNGYFNPHLLVSNDFKDNLRQTFFSKLLDRVRAYQVNTTGMPEESQKVIQNIVLRE